MTEWHEPVTMSAYDLLPDEDRKAIAWVRAYGGLDAVKASVHQGAMEHGYLLKIAEMLGTSIYDGSDKADALLAKISERIMPEGVEWLIESWPRFDDNEPLRWDDEYANGNGGVSPLRHVSLYADGRAMLGKGKTKVVLAPGERVKRPPVLAADGEPLEVGQTVWDVESGTEYEVVGIHTDEDSPVRVMRTDGSHLAKAAKPSTLTHQRPVLDETRRQRRDSVPRAAYERNLAKRQRQVDESHAALRRRNRWIAELEHLLCKEMSYSLRRDAGCLAPEALDADGVEIREGDTVWRVETGEQCKVVEVDSRSVSVDFRVDGDGTKHTGSILPANLTHRAPVIAADGRPLRKGETVYSDSLGEGPFTVREIKPDDDPDEPEHLVWCGETWGESLNYAKKWRIPDQLTHEQPDTWERLEHDAEKTVCEYFGANYDCANCPLESARCAEEVKKDIIRRAKKLAERGA